MEKREESQREAAIRLKQMDDEATARREQLVREEKDRREQELSLAQSKEREAKLKLDQIDAESNAALAKLKVEVEDKAAQRQELLKNTEADVQRKEDLVFQEDIQKLLSLTTSQEETEARIALLSRHLAPEVPEYRRSTIIPALSTKLQSARSPEEVNAIFTILALAGPKAFPAVLRANQDAFSAVYGAMRADQEAHLNYTDGLRRLGVLSTSTWMDIANAFLPGTGAWSYLSGGAPSRGGVIDKRPGGVAAPEPTDEAVKTGKSAHDTLALQLAILSASREMIATALPTLENPEVGLDRCFIPDIKLVGNKNLENISIRNSFIESADLRGLGTADILIQDPAFDPRGFVQAPASDLKGKLDQLHSTTL